jgi:hypothetical protein
MRIDYETIEVVLPGPEPARFDRFALSLRMPLDARAREASETLTRMRVHPVRLRVARREGVEGLAVVKRPEGLADEAELAAAVFRSAPGFAFVEIPAREPGTPPLKLDAPAKLRRQPIR